MSAPPPAPAGPDPAAAAAEPGEEPGPLDVSAVTARRFTVLRGQRLFSVAWGGLDPARVALPAGASCVLASGGRAARLDGPATAAAVMDAVPRTERGEPLGAPYGPGARDARPRDCSGCPRAGLLRPAPPARRRRRRPDGLRRAVVGPVLPRGGETASVQGLGLNRERLRGGVSVLLTKPPTPQFSRYGGMVFAEGSDFFTPERGEP